MTPAPPSLGPPVLSCAGRHRDLRLFDRLPAAGDGQGAAGGGDLAAAAHLQLVTVVPISSVAPVPLQPWHYLLPVGSYPPARGPIWVKADMLATVALSRLDRVKGRDARGMRVYQAYQLPAADLAAVYTAVKAALGIA